MATSGQYIATGASVGGSIATYLLPAAVAAGPVGLAIGGAVAAIGALSGTITHLIDGCGQSCVQATDIVNQAETYVQQISEAYWQAPVRTVSLQQYTLQQLDAIFARVAQLCGQIGGTAGANCVKERLTRGYRPPWCTDPSVPLTQCGGWYDVTYDPIANDKGVQPDPSPVASVAAAIPGLGSITSGYGPTILVGLAVLVFVAMKVRGVI